MISLEDIIGMCGLSEAEVDAVAEHEHIPEVAAAALASYLLHKHRGPAHVQTMICEDIRDAIGRDDVAHARELFMACAASSSSTPIPSAAPSSEVRRVERRSCRTCRRSTASSIVDLLQINAATPAGPERGAWNALGR